MTYLLDGITKKSFEDLTYFDQGILLNAFYDRKSKKAYDFLAGKQLGSQIRRLTTGLTNAANKPRRVHTYGGCTQEQLYK
jgi:hypothetical protein